MKFSLSPRQKLEHHQQRATVIAALTKPKPEPQKMETRYIVSLPKSRWRKCDTCAGSGSYFMQGDLHKSSGTVPCQNCHNGIVKQETISEEEYLRKSI
jgi:hypothetical protein